VRSDPDSGFRLLASCRARSPLSIVPAARPLAGHAVGKLGALQRGCRAHPVAMATRLLPAALLGCLAATAQAVVQPDMQHDVLLALPAPPKPAWAPAPELAVGDQVVPGVRMVRGERVVLDCVLNLDKGPADGLEVLACLKDGKTHESLMRVENTSGQYIKFACIAALGLPEDGMPAAEGSGEPARGVPVRLRALWQDEDGSRKVVDASCLIRDRVMDKPYPPLPWVYTGSRMLTVQEAGPDGRVVKRERFMLDNTRSVAVCYDEPDALLASPFPGAREDGRFETNSGLAPPVGAKIQLLIERAELPLTLDEDERGTLKAADADAALDDERLRSLLAARYGADLKPDALRAIAVRVSRPVERQVDVAVRTRLLAAAAAAKVWVVPVFVLAGE
jgi:hypothetical protein